MILQPLKQYPLSHNIAILIILTFLYFFLAKLGLLLAFTGTNVSPIWPAAGFALAATMIFGYQGALAALLGSWFANTSQLLVLFNNISPFEIVAISFIIGCGAGLQAIVGWHLLMRSSTIASFFQKPSGIIKLLFFGSISCLVNANIGMFAMCISGLIPWESYFQDDLIWWLGDTGGVFILTPLLLAWLAVPIQEPTYRSSLELFGMIIAFLFTIAMNYFFQAHFLYLFFSCLVWASIRFHFKGTTLALLITMTVILVETITGYGSFIRATADESFFAVSLLVFVIAPTMLILTAELESRRGVPTVWQGSHRTFPKYTFRFREFFFLKFKK